MLNFDRIADKYDKDHLQDNNSKMQRQAVKKNNKCSLHVLLLGFAVLIVASIAYHFWPAIKGAWATTKAAVVLDEDISLTGISYTEDDPEPIAIVNGKIVHEEDVIDGVRVLKIYKDKVDFERDGRKWSQNMSAADESVSSDLPVLLELGSHKCPPCRQMMPILNELRAEYAGKFQIKYIDVWEDRAAGAKYGVRAIPTQIFYDSKGREVFRHVGFYSKKDILITWKNLGVKL
jgi:thioredoxin 1